MGTVIVTNGLKVKVNAKDHNPPHVHVEGKGASVRINLLTGEAMDNTDFSLADLRLIKELVMNRRDECMTEWERLHGKK